MNSELNINSVISAFIESRYQEVVGTVVSAIKTTSNTARLHFQSTFTHYLEAVLEKQGRAKSFFIRADAENLYSFYIPLAVTIGQSQITLPEASQMFASGSRRTVLSAAAGSGKSMFMRHLAINSIVSKWKMPVFFELRRLNGNTEGLSEHLLRHLIDNKLAVDEDMLESLLQRGATILLLDGFDEVNIERRESLTSELNRLANRYPLLYIVVSSRPDSELESWPEFSMATLEPLQLIQAINLVNKLPFDNEVKADFINDLEESLYQRHTSFASNPLLLSIMLLTYAQSLSIPSKLSVFYNQAYEALFERHDTLKGNFRRQRLSGLDIQDFAKVFSAFCLQSYDARQLEFTKTDCLRMIDEACVIVQVHCKNEAYLADAKDAVGVLVEDGLLIVFPHRSFQEYFAARFIAEATPKVQLRLIEKYWQATSLDTVMSLLYEMRPDIVEGHVLKPALDDLLSAIGIEKEVTMTHYLQFLKSLFSSALLDEGMIRFTLKNNVDYRPVKLLQFCFNNCANTLDPTEYAKREKSFIIYSDELNEGVRISKLTPRSKILVELATGGGMLSLNGLKYAVALRDALVLKKRTITASLKDILARE